MSERDPLRKATAAALGSPVSRAIEEAQRGLVSTALDKARLAEMKHVLRAQEDFRRAFGSIAEFQDQYLATMAPLRHVEEQLRMVMGSRADLSAQVRAATEPLAALQEQWRATLAPLEQLRSAASITGLSAAELQAIKAPFKELQRLQESVLVTARLDHVAALSVPDAGALAHLARTAAAAVSPLAAHQKQFAALGRSLAEQMRAVKVPWALEDAPDLSAIAFARVSHHAGSILDAEPFSQRRHRSALALFGPPLTDAEVAGTSETPGDRDDARVDSGADAALFVFPDEARLPIGRAVGLVVPAPPMPVIRPVGSSEPLSFSPDVDEWLRAGEVTLRFFVVGVLRVANGGNWQRAISPGMLQSWEGSRAKQLAAGRPEFELFHYADLGDWLQVINRNWNGLFAHVFRKKAYLETVFDHLIPLRNEDGHHRPMATTDQLIVVTFTRMLLDRMESYNVAEGLGPLGD